MTYNGWKNRPTWNVALWVGNDELLYRKAVAYVIYTQSRKKQVSWGGFVRSAGLTRQRTPDGYLYDGRGLDRDRLTEMLIELAS